VSGTLLKAGGETQDITCKRLGASALVHFPADQLWTHQSLYEARLALGMVAEADRFTLGDSARVATHYFCFDARLTISHASTFV
jgi:hypothetical protein